MTIFALAPNRESVRALLPDATASHNDDDLSTVASRWLAVTIETRERLLRLSAPVPTPGEGKITAR